MTNDMEATVQFEVQTKVWKRDVYGDHGPAPHHGGEDGP
jgi:hypothetical protein